MKERVNLFWFRRDLRLHDNAGLYSALKSEKPVVPIFIFDTDILDELEDKQDARIQFIYEALMVMQEELKKKSSTLDVRYGKPVTIFRQLIKDYNVDTVFANHDYEPYATGRDKEIQQLLDDKAIQFKTYKDQVIFEKQEVVKDDGSPYAVFTPYARRWKATLNKFYLKSYPNKKYYRNLYQQKEISFPTLQEMEFEPVRKTFPDIKTDPGLIKIYEKQRDFPGLAGTTRMSVHLRFGTISIRELASDALKLNSTYLNELIWREYYQMILWHFPKLVNHAYRAEYDRIEWRNNDSEFKAWCNGMTGYPIVDAGMRELNETGFMHNRVRMIVASFLCKDLLIDWRWGEAYFGKKLLDYELASNNGGWQWCAGTGVDAAPYFRVFNPYLQTKKFDKSLEYIKKWIPELDELSYPQPIVEHEFARDRCLQAYRKALKK